MDLPSRRWRRTRREDANNADATAIDPKGEFKFNEAPPYVASSQGDGMAVDKAGRYYVTSNLGVQIFDPTGRPCGVLPRPDATQPLVTAVLAGKDDSTLFVANGTAVYRRKLTVVKTSGR